MSQESRAAFCEKANQHQSLSDALWAAVQSSDPVQQIANLAAQHGCELTKEEAESIVASDVVAAAEGELDDAALEAVAGGFKISRPGPFQRQVIVGTATGAASGFATGGPVGAAIGAATGAASVIGKNHAKKRWGWDI